MKKSLGILLFFFTTILVLRLISITYGFYVVNIKNNPNENTLSVNSKFLSVEYEDGTATMNFKGDYLFPGDSAEKIFYVENTGDDDVFYNIIIDNVENQFVRTQDLQYEIYVDDNVLDGVDSFNFLTTGAINNNEIQNLYNTISIKKDAKHAVKFVFKYAITDEIQNDDMNKTISFRFNITTDERENLNVQHNVATIIANRKYLNDYKIYGQSIQDGVPSKDTPVEVQSVGNLVTDETSSNYGKYEIPIKVVGKNLLNEVKYVNPSGNATIVNNDDYYLVNTSHNTGGIGWIVKEKFQVGDVISFQAKVNFLSNASTEFTDSVTLRIWNNTQSKWIHAGYNGVASAYSTITLNKDILLKFQNIVLTSSNYKPGDELMFRVSRGMGGDSLNPISFKVYKGTIMATNTAVLGNYVEYEEPIYKSIYLDEPLRKVDGVADYIDFKKQAVVRKVGYSKLTSSNFINKNTWYYDKGWNAYLAAISFATSYQPYQKNGLSNYFVSSNSIYSTSLGQPYVYQIGEDVWDDFITENESAVYFITTEASEETIEDFKAWVDSITLAGKPLKFYGKLLEEKVVPIKIPTILLNDNLNNIIIETDVSPSLLYVES